MKLLQKKTTTMTFSIIINPITDAREIKCSLFNERTQNWETSCFDLDHVNAHESMTDDEIIELAEEWAEETAA